MVRIGDVMGQGRKHADTACKLVCQEQSAIWYITKASTPHAGVTKATPRSGSTEQRSGRCFAWYNTGKCAKGSACPFRGAHNSVGRKRTRERESDHASDDERKSPPRSQARRDDDDRRPEKRHVWFDRKDADRGGDRGKKGRD